jgi:hypothetical protein
MGLPKEIAEFMKSYGVEAADLWEVRGGTYAIKHKALARVAAEQGVTFGPPLWLKIEPQEKIAIVQVSGKLGERSEWSTGEAAPYNNKNAYPVAMAEKRAKDRVTLQLLNAHGSIYSDEEGDDLKKRSNPHVNRANDFGDEHLDPNHDIPPDDPSVQKLLKKDQAPLYKVLQAAIDAAQSVVELNVWGKDHRDQIHKLCVEYQDHLKQRYSQKMKELVEAQEQEAA